MRILYVATDQVVPGVKGGSTHVQAVATELARLGHEVHVAAGRGEGPLPSGVTWHQIGARPHLRLTRAGALRRLARRLRPDAVLERYHNFGGEGLLAAGHVGAAAVLEVNAPITDYRGSPKRRLDRLLLVEPMRRWRDWQCRRADLIVTPMRAIVPAWIDDDRLLETEWGADTRAFHPGAPGPAPFTRQEGEVVAVFAGAFRAWHGAIHLVEAAAALQQRQRRVHAVFIGDGPEAPAVRARAVALGVQRVTFAGPLPYEAMPAALAAADIGVAPFDPAAHAPLRAAFYWSPLKVFEYMASGLPVVAPDLPRLCALIGDGEGGLLYRHGDTGSLIDAIDALATDPSRRDMLSRSARARAERLFSWEAHVRALSAAIERRLK